MLPPVLPIFLVSHGRLIKQLILAGAISEETAVEAGQIGLSNNMILHKLVYQGLIGETTQGKYYANAERLSRNLIWDSYIKKHKK